MVDLQAAKLYLKLESQEEDALVTSFLETSKRLCLDILRQSEEDITVRDENLLSTAILFGLAYLYEHREEANHKELKDTLFHLLLDQRREVF